jgi:ATP-dependent Clp protease ATP-binding subunit ClpC
MVGPRRGEPSALIRGMRQQPFCVLLLDEIEKAGAEVFDVLLTVCDEGRLTDRYGRTTTFRSCVIVRD